MASVTTLPPIESALESFKLHARAQLPGILVKRGIQELGEDQEGDAPEFSIVEIAREVAYIVPKEVDRDDQSPILSDVTWKVAQLRFTAQLDLWAPYRVAQDLMGNTVDKLFYNRLPHQGGLTLASNWYFDRPIVVTAGAGISPRESSATVEGSWQKRWELAFLTDLVVVAPLPIAAEISISLSTQLGPDIVVEPDLIIT